LEINTEGPSTPGVSAEHAVDLWWPDCACRPNQRPRKEYAPRQTQKDPEINDDEDIRRHVVNLRCKTI